MSTARSDRHRDLEARLRGLFEDVSGIDFAAADSRTPFIELGLDSLVLTQAALQVRSTFGIAVAFRELMERYRTLDALARHLDASMPAAVAPRSAAPETEAPPRTHAMAPTAPPDRATRAEATAPAPRAGVLDAPALHRLVGQQLELMRRQLELLRAGSPAPTSPTDLPADLPTDLPTDPPADPPVAVPTASAAVPSPPSTDPVSSEDEPPPERYDVRKAFGAIARIHTQSADALSPAQRARLDTFVRRYTQRTRGSKAYTAEHRPHLADPRVVNGFRPLLKEIVYQIVIERSAGARVWDVDGNEYVDALNGFGMNLFGWRPDFIDEAVRAQLDAGYEIGPQHPLAGEVARRICELTGFDRAALCNTGSEAVMGCIRIARTVTGRSRIVIFSGAYHGIFDEVIVRGTRSTRSIPAAPGILPAAAQNVVVLDYGTPESMQWLREHASELAAVLVEPVQSRRPDFQPREFLRELRELTASSGTLLVFDEIVTGFRAHPGGIQALFGIRADLASYGKVVGGGFPIGVIAGKRAYMDALDGGHWAFGDDSVPTVGVTYFAGTFVRHPLTLAAAHAVLMRLAHDGPELQATLTRSTAAMVDELNAFCRETGAPITLKSFASLWKIVFDEDHPLQDLLFAMMRDRGVHVLDNFPCFLTTAHTARDIAVIKSAFREAVVELQAAEFLPRRERDAPAGLDAARPPVPGARLGRDPEGRPAWFVANPDAPGKFIKLETP